MLFGQETKRDQTELYIKAPKMRVERPQNNSKLLQSGGSWYFRLVSWDALYAYEMKPVCKPVNRWVEWFSLLKWNKCLQLSQVHSLPNTKEILGARHSQAWKGQSNRWNFFDFEKITQKCKVYNSSLCLWE